MTIKDELHSIVDALAEQDAQEALDFLRARADQSSNPSNSVVGESLQALDEALTPSTPRISHEAVSAWLRTWGTSKEDDAERALEEMERRLDEPRPR